ncbi:MAG: 50S ribosomal protein L9 [Candidatus Poribacteria bacterium]|nr:50S ribosomal protein L9 [Candidatus Poribacteria bacterium]
MEIILKKNVERLGEEGAILQVADGYARNFLIPMQLAIRATDKNRRMLEHEKRLLAGQAVQERGRAEVLASRIAEVTCTIQRRAGENDRLFGSVTSMDIAEALAAQSIEVDRRHIELDDPIRELGVFMVPIRFHADVTANIQVVVVREE